jgi:general secretion pathway protein F
MPAFAYKAFNTAGQLSAGEMDAPSAQDVEISLARDGLTPFEVLLKGRNMLASPSRVAVGEKWWQRDIGGPRQPKTTELAGFANELAMLTGAGVSIDQSLRMLAENSGGRFQRRAAGQLLAEVLEGRSLSNAMKRQPQAFTDELVAIVLAAESSADLSGGLARLAAHLTRRAQLQSELRSALIYPAVLLIASLGVLLVVINVLIPNIRPLFDEAKTPLPGFIKVLDDLQSFVVGHWLAILVASAILCLSVRHAFRTAAIRAWIDAILLRAPVAGAVIRRLEGARFTRALGAQVISGVSLMPALSIASETLQNAESKRLVVAAIEQIRDGVKPSQALKEVNPFPPLAYQLIAVGEGAGRLGPVLLQLAETFEQAQQVAVKRAMSLLTPLLTLGLGLLVGLLMLSLMNAITGLNDFALR